MSVGRSATALRPLPRQRSRKPAPNVKTNNDRYRRKQSVCPAARIASYHLFIFIICIDFVILMQLRDQRLYGRPHLFRAVCANPKRHLACVGINMTDAAAPALAMRRTPNGIAGALGTCSSETDRSPVGFAALGSRMTLGSSPVMVHRGAAADNDRRACASVTVPAKSWVTSGAQSSGASAARASSTAQQHAPGRAAPSHPGRPFIRLESLDRTMALSCAC